MSTIKENITKAVSTPAQKKPKSSGDLIKVLDFSEEARDEEMKGRVPYANVNNLCEYCFLYHDKAVPLPSDRVCKEKDCPGHGRVQPKR